MSIANLLKSSNSKKPGSSQVTPTKGIAGLLAASNPTNGLAYVPRNTTQTPEKESTLGKVGNFAKEIVKDPIKTLLVTPAARTTEAVTRLVAPNSLAAKGYEAMSDAGESQNFKLPILGNIEVAPQKAFGQGGAQQITGQALKSAAYLAPFAPGAGAAIKALPTAGKVAAGFTEGAAFGAGSAMEQGAPTGEVFKQGVIGGALGAAIPGAMGAYSKFASKTAPKVATVAAQDAASVVANTVGKEVTTPPISFTPQGARLTPVQGMKALEGLGYSMKQQSNILQKIPTLNETGYFSQAELEAAFKGVKPSNKPKVKVPKNITPATIVEKGKPVETPTIPSTAIIPDAPTQTTTKVTPEVQAKAETIANKVRAEEPTLNDFEHQQNIKQTTEILTEDRQSIIDVALGKKAPSGLIPSTAYLRVATDIAEEAAKQGDLTLANQLAISNIGRKAGQSLQALASASKNSIVGIIRDVRTTLEDALPTVIKKRKEAEVAKIQESITKILDSFDGKVPTPKQVSEALTELICK